MELVKDSREDLVARGLKIVDLTAKHYATKLPLDRGELNSIGNEALVRIIPRWLEKPVEGFTFEKFVDVVARRRMVDEARSMYGREFENQTVEYMDHDQDKEFYRDAEFERPFAEGTGIRLTPLERSTMERRAAGATCKEIAEADGVSEQAVWGRTERARYRNFTDDEERELTKRQVQVLKLVSFGLGNKEIGAKLYITEETVKTHLKETFRRLGVSGTTCPRTAAVRAAFETGLLQANGPDTIDERVDAGLHQGDPRPTQEATGADYQIEYQAA